MESTLAEQNDSSVNMPVYRQRSVSASTAIDQDRLNDKVGIACGIQFSLPFNQPAAIHGVLTGFRDV